MRNLPGMSTIHERVKHLGSWWENKNYFSIYSLLSGTHFETSVFLCFFFCFVLQRAHCVTVPFQKYLNGSTPSADSQYVIVPCRWFMAGNFLNTSFHVLSTSHELESAINALLALTNLTLKKIQWGKQNGYLHFTNVETKA